MPPKKRKSAPKSKTPTKTKQQKKTDDKVQDEIDVQNENINDEVNDNNTEESNETKPEDIIENTDIISKSHKQKLLVHEIVSDPLTQISLEYWAPNSPKKLKPFDQNLINKIYNEEIVAKGYNQSRIMLLELSYYLEK